MTEEIDYTSYDIDGLIHLLRMRDRQAIQSRSYWLRAAIKALDGDFAELRNRVEIAGMGPVKITNGDTEYTFRG